METAEKQLSLLLSMTTRNGAATVEETNDLPAIMLTARVHRQDRILGLNSGADDYLPKPFDPDELLARIRAVCAERYREFESQRAFDDREIQVTAATRKCGARVRRWS